jgi:hypothetical protein
MMRASIWTGMCAAVVSVATVGMMAQQPPAPQTSPTAQTPQTAPAPQTTPAPQATTPTSTEKKITLTGCLKAAPQAAGDVNSASPTGTAGSATSAATGTSGTAAAPIDAKFVLTGASASPGDTPSAAPTYRLIANPAALSAHVGKKLELVGSIDPSSTADPKDPSASAPAFRVESGKIVAASCTP